MTTLLFSADYYDIRIKGFAMDYRDLTLHGAKERPSTINILSKALKILSNRLCSRVADIGHSTIAAISGLAITEVCPQILLDRGAIAKDLSVRHESRRQLACTHGRCQVTRRDERWLVRLSLRSGNA